MKKKTFSEIKNEFDSITDTNKFELLGSDGTKDLNILCKRCNRSFVYKTFYNWKTGTKTPDCPYCGKNSKNIPLNIIVERLKDRDFEIVNLDEYKNTHSKILVRDLRCSLHNPFYTTFNKIQQGLRCPTCGNIKSKDCERLSKDEVNLRISKVPMYLELYDVDITNYKRYNGRDIIVTCKKCNHKFLASLGSITAGCGCPKCRQSHIEKNSIDFLMNNGYTVIKHFRGFNNLKGKKYPLELDIVLKSTSIGDIYIELNGEFHYDFSNRFTDSKEIINNDKKKVDYFINKDPSTLIVIPFWEFKRIYSILNSIENLEELKEKFNITIIQSNKIIKELKQPNN